MAMAWVRSRVCLRRIIIGNPRFTGGHPPPTTTILLSILHCGSVGDFGTSCPPWRTPVRWPYSTRSRDRGRLVRQPVPVRPSNDKGIYVRYNVNPETKGLSGRFDASVTELRQILADGASIRGIPVIRRSAVPLYVVFETVDRKQQQIAITATVNRDNGYMVQYRLGSGSGDPEVGAWHEIGEKYGNIIGFDVGATSVNMAVENLFNLARKKEKKEKEKKEKKEKKKIAFYQEMKRNLDILAVHLIESVRFCEIQKYISSGLTTKTTGSDTIGSDTSGSETSGSDTTGSDTIGSDTSESDTNRGPIEITEQISKLIHNWGKLSESYIDGKSFDWKKSGIPETTIPQLVGLLKAKKGTN